MNKLPATPNTNLSLLLFLLFSLTLPPSTSLSWPLPSSLPASLVSKLALKVTDVLNLVQVEEGKEEPVDEGSVTLRNIADNGNYTVM